MDCAKTFALLQNTVMDFTIVHGSPFWSKDLTGSNVHILIPKEREACGILRHE